ncbi:MAG: aminodeoxychorismate lyase [Flavobacteriaceae bacterium]|nr:aminodeoxychorismate lyase [Flavobacteriaceae bacterium]|tara:strand:- start:44316 stop:45341 length:1026 start_codon:yes stop_codon:yes gene_type:complete
MNKKVRNIGIVVVAVLLIAVFSIYQRIYSSNVSKEGELFVSTGDSLANVLTKISPLLENTNSFEWVAGLKKYKTPKSGRYLIKEGMSNNDVINMLRIGNQTPVKVSFNNQDTLEKLAGRIAVQIEADSSALLNAFTDEIFLKENNFTSASVLQIFIPNTYEYYWNTSAQKFRDRMLANYKKFWNSNRLAKAKQLKMTPSEVITLASIVQKETAKREERPIVAGLYLNRLKRGWALQADPTVVYAIKQQKGQDFMVYRVLRTDIDIDSPYNTYKYRGLPPSLIGMPDISSIDAVLNPKKHQYMYMCASAENIGYHEFSKSLAQHNRNAAKYQRWLNKQRIFR